MLADFPYKEIDSSFLKMQLGDRSLPEPVVVRRSLTWILLFAFGLSFFLHGLLFIIQWRHAAVTTQPNKKTQLSVELTRIVAPASVPRVVDPEPESLAPANNLPPQPAPASLEDTKAEISEERPARVIQPLTGEELREIIQHSTAKKTLHQAPADSIAANVFNPVLRRRLQEEERKPDLQRADTGPKTHTDPSGATIVDLGGGKCLRSSAPKSGEAQNWYMTSCGGKSESEEMMERVNQAVNGKLHFDD